MNARRAACWLWMMMVPLTQAAESPDDLFARARANYESGDYATAAEGYNRLLTNGFAAFEVFFNLGNAYYRSGDIGLAVAAYQRAAYLHPRDPDVRANLRMAQQQSGALRYAEPGWMNAMGQLTHRQWRQLGMAGLWLAGLAGAVYWLRSRSRWWGRLALLGLAAMLMGGMGALRWRLLAHHPEAVIVARDVQSKFAPLPSAMPHFALPEGSIVRIREQSGSWCKVEVARQEGWIPTSACVPLSPP